MFNYIKLLFCAVVSVALFYGCDNNDDNIIPGKPPKKLENAYISNYVIVDQLRYFYMSDTYDSIPTDPHIQFWLVGRSCSDDELEKLSREYGDTTYNGNKIRSYFVGPVVSDSIKKIDVTCRSDYDAQHPKGTSLADIVLFCGHSYYNFIHNGYTVADAEKNKPENENLCKFVEARWSPSDDNDIADPWATVVPVWNMIDCLQLCQTPLKTYLMPTPSCLTRVRQFYGLPSDLKATAHSGLTLL